MSKVGFHNLHKRKTYTTTEQLVKKSHEIDTVTDWFRNTVGSLTHKEVRKDSSMI